MPKITVLIPNYNYGHFLEKRIQSVLNQTYQDLEVIYLDNGSTDSSNQVFAKFMSDKRIRAIYNQVNSGTPYTQWNKGMREAKGEYVWIAESDDYADERLLAELITKLDKYPTVGIAYCQSWKIDENDNIVSCFQEWTADLDEQRWQKDFVNNGKDECSRYLIFKCILPNASAALIRKSVYEKVGGVDERMRVAGDWMLWAKMLLISDISFVAEPLNYYRKHSKSVTSNCHKRGLLLAEYCQVIQYILQNVQIPEDILEKVCDRTIDWWLNTVLHQNNIGLSRNQKIYRVLSEIDPRVNRRLINRWLLKKIVKRENNLSVKKGMLHLAQGFRNR